MKERFFVFLNLILCLNSGAQNWNWLNHTMSLSFARADEIAVDAANNCFVTGTYNASTTFGSFTLTTPAPWTGYFFLAKYAAGGNCIWAISDSTQYDGTNLEIDASGNLYVTSYQNSVYSLSKWDSSGNQIWRVPLPTHISVTDLVTDASGNCWIAGRQTTGQSVFGSDTIRDTVGIVARYDMNGTALGAVSFGKHGKISPEFFSLDASGNYVIAATLSGRDTLDGQPLNIQGSTIMVFKTDAMGNLIWSLTGDAPAMGNAGSSPFGMTVDAQDNCYVTGTFVIQDFVFGNDTVFMHPSGRTAAIMKIDANGNLLWLRQPAFTGTGDVYFMKVTSNSNGVYMSGYTEENFSVGPVSVSDNTNPYHCGYVMAFDPAGNPQYEFHSSLLNSNVMPRSIAVNNAGDMWLGGMYRNASALGPFNLPATANGADDMFLLNLSYTSVNTQQSLYENSSVVLAQVNDGVFSLLLDEETAKAESIFCLYDVTGRMVKSFRISSAQTVIDCADIPKGIYLWSLSDSNHAIANGKVVR